MAVLDCLAKASNSVVTRQELEKLREVVLQYPDLIVISDEIYAQVNFSGQPYTGFSQHYPEGTIITGGLSKAQGAGGYRMGFLACPPNMDQLIKAGHGAKDANAMAVEAIGRPTTAT